MDRPIDSREARRLIRQHKILIADLLAAEKYESDLRKEIVVAVDDFVVEENSRILNEIPVDELNRDKRGIRIKTLRDHGYKSIADINKASVYALSSINGISEEAARTIKYVANNISDTVIKTMKVKISADNKSKCATRLIFAVSCLKNSKEYIAECKNILKNARTNIKTGISDLIPATSGLLWIFTSKRKRERAVKAFEMLNTLLSGVYHQSATDALNEIKAVKKSTTTWAWGDFCGNSVSFFNILEDIVPGVLGTDDLVYGLPDDLAQEIQDQPLFLEGLRCELRRYQEWGVKYILHQKQVLLGDEMGLGKTIQAIAAMVSLRNSGSTHFLVICPASVLTNWCREIQKKSDLTVVKIHGYDRGVALQLWVKNGGVAVTTYETTGFLKLDVSFKYSMLVVDEAHYIKNPEANRTINTKNLGYHAERLLFMTGTALENKVSEMVSLIRLLQPHIASSVHGMEFLSSAPQFREKVAPVYYRRKRDDVLTELPDLVENREWCTMSALEEATYEESILSRSYMEARRVSWNISDLSKSSKANRMLELIADAAADGRKVIVFSFFLDTIEKVLQLLGDRCYGPINGSIPPQKRQEILDEFDAAAPGSVLAAQIQAGGTGLNIQSASVVIICEPQFKPSTENQAISRSYRMGQTRNVFVHRLLSEGSVDERITGLLESKQAIFDAFADKSIAAAESMELDNNTFGDIMEEEINRINAKREKVGLQT